MTSAPSKDSVAHLSEHELLEIFKSGLSDQHRLEPVRISSILVEALTRRAPESGIPTDAAHKAYQYLASDAFRQSPWGKEEVAVALIAKYNDPEGNTPDGMRSPEKAINIQQTLIEKTTMLLSAESLGHPYERFISEGRNQRYQDPTCRTWVKAASYLAPTNRSEDCRVVLTHLIWKGLTRNDDMNAQKEALNALPTFISALPDYSHRLVDPFNDCLNSLSMDVFLTAAQNSQAVIHAAPYPFLKSLQCCFNGRSSPPACAIRIELETAIRKTGKVRRP